MYELKQREGVWNTWAMNAVSCTLQKKLEDILRHMFMFIILFVMLVINAATKPRSLRKLRWYMFLKLPWGRQTSSDWCAGIVGFVERCFAYRAFRSNAGVNTPRTPTRYEPRDHVWSVHDHILLAVWTHRAPWPHRQTPEGPLNLNSPPVSSSWRSHLSDWWNVLKKTQASPFAFEGFELGCDFCVCLFRSGNKKTV